MSSLVIVDKTSFTNGIPFDCVVPIPQHTSSSPHPIAFIPFTWATFPKYLFKVINAFRIICFCFGIKHKKNKWETVGKLGCLILLTAIKDKQGSFVNHAHYLVYVFLQINSGTDTRNVSKEESPLEKESIAIRETTYGMSIQNRIIFLQLTDFS